MELFLRYVLVLMTWVTSGNTHTDTSTSNVDDRSTDLTNDGIFKTSLTGYIAKRNMDIISIKCRDIVLGYKHIFIPKSCNNVLTSTLINNSNHSVNTTGINRYENCDLFRTPLRKCSEQIRRHSRRHKHVNRKSKNRDLIFTTNNAIHYLERDDGTVRFKRGSNTDRGPKSERLVISPVKPDETTNTEVIAGTTTNDNHNTEGESDTGLYEIDSLAKAYELLYTLLWMSSMNDTDGSNFPNLTINAEEQCILTLTHYYDSQHGQLFGKFIQYNVINRVKC